MEQTAEQLLAWQIVYASHLNPGLFQWWIHRIGVMKMDIADGTRFKLHLWSDEVRGDYLSDQHDMHDHVWHLRSRVLSGRVEQYRYTYTDDAEAGDPYLMQTFGGGAEVGDGEWVRLVRSPLEVVPAGETYEMRPEEIHKSLPIDGTVTLVERMPAQKGNIHIFWGHQKKRAVETLRVATDDEVRSITRNALDLWRKD